MAHHVLLNNVDHKDLRIITTRSADFGDDIMFTPTFHREFRNLQAHYPIFFRKGPEADRYHAVAIFGFKEQENLFLGANGWDAAYIPLTVERQPFLIGFQERQDEDVAKRQPVVHVDLDSPRVSETEGVPVFLQHGGISEYLERINRVLHTIHEGLAAEKGFIDALLELELLESFTLDVDLDVRSRFRVAGFYTINEDRLGEFGGEALAALNARGYLQPIYMALASLSNIADLVNRKKRQRMELQ